VKLDESFWGDAPAASDVGNIHLATTASRNPDQEAEMQLLGKRFGVPTDLVRADYDGFKQKAAVIDRRESATEPGVQAWVAKSPDNAALAADKDLRVMGRIERTIRSLGEGFAGQFVGSGLTGIGHGLDAIQRRIVGAAASLVLPEPMAGGKDQISEESLAGQPIGEGFKALGQPTKQYWREQGVPLYQQDFSDQVASGIGQVIGQLPLAATPAGWAMMFGQGADQLADKVAKDDAPQWKKDLAILGGGTVTAVTEKFALDRWAKLSPLASLKNPLASRAAGIGIASASEGGQEFTENVLQDVIRQQLTNPNAAINLGEAAGAGGVGATVGGIVRTVIESALHIKGRHQQQAIQEIVTASKEADIGKRSPEKMAEFAGQVAEGTGAENVFIPAEAFTRYFQSINADPAEAAALIGAKNYDEAVAAGTDLVIPMGDFTAKLAPSEHMGALMPDVRLHQGDLTARELEFMQANQEARDQYLAQQYEQLVAEGEKSRGVNAAIDKVVTDIEGQLLSSGVERSTAKTQAQLMRGVAVLAQRAFPNVDPVVAAEKLWDQYGLTVQRDLPPILTNLKNADVQLDPLLDRLRAGAIPKEQEAFGQPLHEFIRAMGGVQDQGGELSARDADVGNAPFVKNLIQQLGMDFDGARELAAQHGFPVGETEADFISALTGSLEGNPIYSPNNENQQTLDLMQTLESLDRALKDAGVDLNAVDNATARKMLEQSGEVSGARFDQPIVDTASRSAQNFTEARAAAKAFQGKQLTNQVTGTVATVSRNSLDKMLSSKAVAKSETPATHSFAVANLDALFERAILGWSKPDAKGDSNIVAIHRFFAPLHTDNGTRLVKMTVKETAQTDRSNALYTVEAVELNEKSPAAQWVGEIANADGVDPRTIRSVGDVINLAQAIQDGKRFYQSDRPTIDAVRKQWDDAGIKHAISERDGVITVSQIVVPEGERGAGNGTAAMQALVDYADQTGQHIALSPSADFGGNKKRLVEFYRRFGFIENKGRNRAFSTSESMYRQAAGKVLYQKQSDQKRGFLEIGAGRKMRIGLTENANLSTFLHETGHFYLEMMGDLAANPEADQQVKDDYAAILSWMGVTDRSQITVEQHEKFARANEAYLMEGNAPAPELRGAFQRFKAWLTHIYRSMTSLDVKLSKEVRDVFDRIYATDQEIEAAKDSVDVAPLFLDAATMGMSEAEFAVYRKSVGEVSATAQERLAEKLMREYQRGLKAWWKEERAKVAKEVTAEVEAQPVYIAFDALMRGEMDGQPFKLSKEDLVRRYGETFLASLPKGFGRVYSADGGIDLDTAAEMAGFYTGDDMVKALVEMRQKKALIEAETDQRMAERYGDMMLDGSMADEAKAALHNEHRADILAIELRALKRKAKEVAPFVRQAVGEAKSEAKEAVVAAKAETKDAKAQAKAEQAARVAATDVPAPAMFRRAAAGMIDQMQVKDIQPNAYLIAGRKAAREAFAALARNDVQTAAAAKQRELLNHYLYLEATKAKQEAEAIQKHARTFEKAAKRERIGKAGGDYLGQIDALLARYEMAKVTINALSRRERLREFIASREAEGDMVIIPEELQDESRQVNWREAPMSELRALHDALKNLEHLASFKNKLLRKRAAIDFAEVKAELLAAIEGNIEGSTGERGKLNDKGDGIKEKVIANLRKFDAGLIKVEQLVEWLDGGKINGPWARYLFDLADDAQTREYDLHAGVTAKIMALHESMPKAWGNSLYDKTDVRLPGVDHALTRYDLISIALNCGNQSNYDKLLKGRGWSDAQAQGALSRLTDQDWEYVQGVWDTIESLWPEIAALQKRVAGVEPDKIEPKRIITASGREFAGGYFPLVYDPALSRVGEKQDDASESVQDFMARGYGRANTDKGHTKGRIDDFAAPLRLDYEQVLTSHLAKVIKDISHREAILSMNKILNNAEIKAAIIDKIGMEKYQLLATWEQSLISDRADTLHRPLQWYNAIFRGLRTNTAIVTMGWKLSTAFSQIAGFAASMDTVKPVYLGAALRDFVRSPGKMVDMVMEKSGEMRHRAGTIERDMKDQLLKTRGEHGIKVAVQRSAFYLTAMADRVVSVPTWLGGYRQALDAGMSEEDAIRAGDRAVRLSQGAGGAKDLAAAQRNSELMKLLTMYYTPFSVLYARLRDMGHSYKAPKDLPRLVARSVALVILPAVLGDLLAGRAPDDDEDKTLWAIRKAMLYPFASIPLIRDLANWKIEPELAKIAGGNMQYQPGYKFTPIVSAVEKIGAMPGKLLDGWTGARPWDDVAWDGLEASGYVFGLPTAQPRITGEYLYDLFTGQASPENAAEAMHDTLFRRPSERR